MLFLITCNSSTYSLHIFFFNGSTAPWGPRPLYFSRLHDHTETHTTLGRTPLDEWSARRRDLYLTKHNTHNRQTSMPPVGFEPTILVSEQPQTHALDCTANGIGILYICRTYQSKVSYRRHIYNGWLRPTNSISYAMCTYASYLSP
jgi:hypothetical protein